jgi:mannosyltransferase OCH1-like enzyme
MSDAIPKVIHQTYPVKAGLAADLSENINHTRALNPQWQYRLYDDADIEVFIVEYYGAAVLDCYRKINPDYGAARADLFRYLLIYALGGVYLDIKARVAQPFEDVITGSDRFILSQWDNDPQGSHPGWGVHPDLADVDGGEYQQWHIIAVAGHPYLKAVIEAVLNNIESYSAFKQGVGRLGVLRVTGPIAYTRAIESVKSMGVARVVDIYADFGIEYSIYQGLDSQKTHGVFFKKHYTGLNSPVVVKHFLFDRCVTSFYFLKRVFKRLLA